MFMWMISTSNETEITSYHAAHNPDIDDNKIAWSEKRNQVYDIYMYDLSTSKETQISYNRSADCPAIYGNNAVWQDYRTGASDIYMSTISGDEPEPTFPVANFSTNVISGYVPLTIQFTDHSQNAMSWNWDFGDKTSSTVQNPMLTFSTSGNYTVNLTVSNANGTDSKLATINVFPINVLKLTPKITWSNPADIAYRTSLNSKQLNAKASVPGTFIYTPPAGTLLPVGAQTLKVTFTPKDTTKCTTATQTVTINVVTVPQANFLASPTKGKAQLTVTFSDKSTGSPTSYLWDFGDKSTSKDPNPVHTYSKTGKYRVSLTVKNSVGSNTKKVYNYITVNKK